jgi:uncharacterized protein YutE (UPF0331/DUF86 family)
MDKDVVSAKLESLRRCVQRIEDKTPATAKSLGDDHDLQDIICINLQRAIQVCVDLASHVIADTDLPAPTAMSESFEPLCRLGLISAELASRMRKAVGFRNVAVYAYQKINWTMVYKIITTRLDDFRAFAEAMARAAQL